MFEGRPSIKASVFSISFAFWRSYPTRSFRLICSTLVIGSIVLAFGVTLERLADFYLPGEGLVQAISYKYKLAFDKVKVCFDVAQPTLAIIISLIVLHNISGMREGTIISAFIVGPFVGLFSKMFKLKS